jgi:hypothetical protein
MIVIQTFWSSDSNHKVEIFQRDDATFGFAELRFAADENCWFQGGRYSIAIIDTLDSAIREAKGRVSWLNAPESFSKNPTN